MSLFTFDQDEVVTIGRTDELHKSLKGQSRWGKFQASLSSAETQHPVLSGSVGASGLIVGGEQIMASLRKVQKPGESLLEAAKTNHKLFKMHEPFGLLYELNESQREQNSRRYGYAAVLNEDSARMKLKDLEDTLKLTHRRLTQVTEWSKRSSQLAWEHNPQGSILSDTFLDFARECVFGSKVSGSKISGGNEAGKLSRDTMSYILEHPGSYDLRGVIDLDEIILAFKQQSHSVQDIIVNMYFEDFETWRRVANFRYIPPSSLPLDKLVQNSADFLQDTDHFVGSPPPPYPCEGIVFLRSCRRFDEVHQGARPWHPDEQHEVKFELYRR